MEEISRSKNESTRLSHENYHLRRHINNTVQYYDTINYDSFPERSVKLESNKKLKAQI